MYCDKCGAFNDDNALYCESCGNQLADSGQQVYLTDEKKEQIKKKLKQGADMSKKGMKKAVETVKGVDTNGVKDKFNETYAANKKIIIPVAAVLAVLLIGVVALGVIGGQNSPQKVAEKFFKAYADGKYGTMYSYFFDYQSDYINKDTVVAYLNSQTNNAGGAISKFKVQPSSYYSDDYYNNEESGNSLAFSQNMQVTYLPSGDSRERTLLLEVVSLKDTGPKAFRKYKVTLSEAIAENVFVIAGGGSTVTIDGVKLENPVDYKEMVDSNAYEEDRTVLSEYVDVYNLGRIISGEHKFEVSGGGFETKEFKISLYDSSKCNLTSDEYSRELTKESKAAIDKKSDAIIKALFYGAINDKSFSSLGIEDPVGINAEVYNEIVEEFEGVTSLKINEVTLDDSYSEDGMICQTYDVKFTYTYNSSYSEDTFTEDDDSSIDLLFAYSDKSKTFELIKIDY